MNRTMIDVVAGKSKALGALAAAVLAGGIAGGIISSGLAGASPTPQVTGTPTPHATSTPGAQGVHGQCVSKVARNKNAMGGKNHNHGGAVSAAAHSCPHGP
jgi:hypothetical protein